MSSIIWQEEHGTAPAFDAPSGDRFDRLYADRWDDVTRYVVRRVGERGLADAVADVFAVAKERIAARPTGEDALPWLYAIAAAVVRMQPARESAACPDCGGHHHDADPDGAPREDVTLLCAVGGLAEDDREILRLRAWEGLSNAQIAIVTGLPKRAVEVRLQAVEERLRDAMPRRRSETDDEMWRPPEEPRC